MVFHGTPRSHPATPTTEIVKDKTAKKAPKPKASTAKSVDTAKQRIEKKAEDATKQRHDENKVPTVRWLSVEVIKFLGGGSAPMTTVVLAELTQTKPNTLAKTTLKPMVDAGLIKTHKEGTSPQTYSLSRSVGKSPNLPALLDALPTSTSESMTCGFLGGKVFGSAKAIPEAKPDIWKNVRYGRACAAVLKPLVAAGVVGVYQNGIGQPKHYYRLPRK